MGPTTPATATCSACSRPCMCSTARHRDRKSTRLNSSHSQISYAVFCLKKKKQNYRQPSPPTRTFITQVYSTPNGLILIQIPQLTRHRIAPEQRHAPRHPRVYMPSTLRR